jgi:hypothetical protein
VAARPCPTSARPMRQMRTFTSSVAMHKHTVGPLPAGLGNRDCHTVQRLLITARLPADLRRYRLNAGQDTARAYLDVPRCLSVGRPLGTQQA